MLCKDSKQHHVMFHELNSVSSLLCIAQNVRFEIPYKDLYFETPFLMIFKCYAWASYDSIAKKRNLSNQKQHCCISTIAQAHCYVSTESAPKHSQYNVF